VKSNWGDLLVPMLRIFRGLCYVLLNGQRGSYLSDKWIKGGGRLTMPMSSQVDDFDTFPFRAFRNQLYYVSWAGKNIRTFNRFLE
jgi:hypothetical protein